MPIYNSDQDWSIGSYVDFFGLKQGLILDCIKNPGYPDTYILKKKDRWYTARPHGGPGGGLLRLGQHPDGYHPYEGSDARYRAKFPGGTALPEPVRHHTSPQQVDSAGTAGLGALIIQLIGWGLLALAIILILLALWNYYQTRPKVDEHYRAHNLRQRFGRGRYVRRPQRASCTAVFLVIMLVLVVLFYLYISGFVLGFGPASP